MKRHEEQFGLTESEILWDKISHKRFLEFVADKNVLIVSATEDENVYGEFLFVELKRNNVSLTFYGLGYHEQREQVVKDYWTFYVGTVMNPELSTEQLEKIIKNRLANLDVHDEPSSRGKAFSLLLDMVGDEDGLMAEMEDHEAMFGSDVWNSLFGEDE